jgi:flagellar basal body rod protein FlgG
LYTRNGSFHVAASGLLVTEEGHPVRAIGGGPIRVVSSSPVEVAPDGTVTQDGQPLGALEIADFQDPSVLLKQGSNYYRAAGAAPAPAHGVQVLQGKLESSNVSSAEGAVRLVNVMRQFEMLQKAVALGAEMNRRSVEEVARASP